MRALETEKKQVDFGDESKVGAENKQRASSPFIYLYIYFAALLSDQTITAADKTLIGKHTLFLAAGTRKGTGEIRE